MDLTVPGLLFFLCMPAMAYLVLWIMKRMKVMMEKINAMQHDLDRLSEFSLKHIRDHE